MVLSGEKRFVEKADLKPISVAHYPEINVKTLYDQYKDHKLLKPFMPPSICKGRTLDRAYFFNVMNTFVGDELMAIIRHAQSLR